MRKRSAFWFVPELVGEAATVLNLTKSPIQLYIDTSLKVLRTATDVFSLYQNHKITKAMEQNRDEIVEMSIEQDALLRDYIKEEQIREIEIQYLKVKQYLNESKQVDEVLEILTLLIEDNLRKVISISSLIRRDESFRKICEIDELYRRSLRSYKNIISLHCEEVV